MEPGLVSCIMQFLPPAPSDSLLLLRYKVFWDLLDAHALPLAHLPRPKRLQATGGPAWSAAGLHTTHLLGDSLYTL